MAAQHSLDVLELPDDGRQRLCVDIAIVVQIRNAAFKRRVVQQHDGGFERICRQRVLQPAKPVAVDVAMVLGRRA
ncbi:hypothetical protein D3C71_1364070 [compost metagenome]